MYHLNLGYIMILPYIIYVKLVTYYRKFFGVSDKGRLYMYVHNNLKNCFDLNHKHYMCV